MPSPTVEINLLRHGRPEPPAPTRNLRAGPLLLTFEDTTGWVRRVRLGEREVVRAIYGAVRDQNWGTVEPCISHLVIEEIGPGAFQLSFTAECRQGDVDFVWRGTLTGAADGTLTYTFDGEARTAFSRNRIGLCVLHPDRECAGQPVVIEHTDGSVEKSVFPERIAPHPPFFEIRAVRHNVLPGLDAEVGFAGETFETEDQRNWTDGSFKTYGTPLALPFPVEVEVGARVRQTVTLTLHGNVPQKVIRGRPAPEVTLTASGEPRPLPALGLSWDDEPLSSRVRERLRRLNLSHLRADLHLARGEWRAVLRAAVNEANALDAGLELAVFAPADAETANPAFAALAGEENALSPPVARWLIYADAGGQTTPYAVLNAAYCQLSVDAPDIPLLAGVATNFAELNRERPARNAPIDGTFFALNPQVHAFDDATLMENLAPQAQTVRSARAFIGDDFLAVSPVTLTPRGGANGFSGPEADPRLGALLAAAWTLGSLRYLADAGADSVTYFATHGPHGVLSGSGVVPLYHVLADVNEFAGARATPLETSDPRAVVGLVLLMDGRRRTLVANLTPDPQQVRVPVGGNAFLTLLDETTARRAMNEPEAFRAAPAERTGTTNGGVTLDLLPYAVARMDEEEK